MIVPALVIMISAFIVLSFSTGLLGVLVSAVLYGIGFGSSQPALQATTIRSSSIRFYYSYMQVKRCIKLFLLVPPGAEGGMTTGRCRRSCSSRFKSYSLTVSLSKALESFQKRCGLQEVTVFVSTLLLQYKKGGDDLAVALRSLSKELWEKRKALTRTMGEEASSKLVFPMVIVFLVVMVIVAAPAVMMMNAT